MAVSDRQMPCQHRDKRTLALYGIAATLLVVYALANALRAQDQEMPTSFRLVGRDGDGSLSGKSCNQQFLAECKAWKELENERSKSQIPSCNCSCGATLPTQSPSKVAPPTARQFSGQRRFSKGPQTYRSKETLSASSSWKYTGPSCRFWTIVSLRQSSNVSDCPAIQSHAKLGDDWCMVVVGGHKAIHDEAAPRHVFLDREQQREIAKTIPSFVSSLKLEMNHLARKNLGYVYAIANGAELIWDVDEANSLVADEGDLRSPFHQNATGFLDVAGPSAKFRTCRTFNPYMAFDGGLRKIWSRGLPIHEVKKNEECHEQSLPESLQFYRLRKETIGVFHSIAHTSPDTDLLWRTFKHGGESLNLTNAPPVTPGRAKLAPFNAESTMFAPQAFWMLCLLPTRQATEQGESDILRAYIGQRLMQEIGLNTVFSPIPVVERKKDPQTQEVGNDLISNMQNELARHQKYMELIDFLGEWKPKALAEKSPQMDFVGYIESLYIALYENNFMEEEDVTLVQEWLQFLVSANYTFPKLPKEKVFETCQADWPELQLFLPDFPGGVEGDLKNLLGVSAKFFWPTERMNVLFAFDASIEQAETIDGRSTWAKYVFDLFPTNSEQLALVYQPRSESELGPGHDIQQLVMFWADNFTDAEYVGFIDDDAAISAAVHEHDLFDEQGRARLIVRHQPTASVEVDKKGGALFWLTLVPRRTKWSLGFPEVLRAMNYFPVVIKTAHLKLIREFMMKTHPEFQTFDQLFATLRTAAYSQFNIMANYLWMHHREEYSWHFQPTGTHTEGVAKGKGDGSRAEGTPQELGITEEMLLPIPRIAYHFNYQRLPRREDPLLWSLLRGYCVSQSLKQEEYDRKRCGAPENWKMNEEFQYCFEMNCWQHPKRDELYEGWKKRNCARSWDEKKLEEIFGNGNPQRFLPWKDNATFIP